MEKHLGLEYSPEARERFLKDNCDKVESLGYMKHFAPDEIDERKTRLADISIQIAEIEAEKKAKMEEFKALLKEPTQTKETLLLELKNKAQFVTENCYKFIAMDEGKAAYYNSEGLNVLERPLFPDEKQTTIFQMMPKSGTHD